MIPTDALLTFGMLKLTSLILADGFGCVAKWKVVGGFWADDAARKRRPRPGQLRQNVDG